MKRFIITLLVSLAGISMAAQITPEVTLHLQPMFGLYPQAGSSFTVDVTAGAKFNENVLGCGLGYGSAWFSSGDVKSSVIPVYIYYRGYLALKEPSPFSLYCVLKHGWIVYSDYPTTAGTVYDRVEAYSAIQPGVSYAIGHGLSLYAGPDLAFEYYKHLRLGVSLGVTMAM